MVEKEYKIDGPVNIETGDPKTPNKVYNELLVRIGADDMKSNGYSVEQTKGAGKEREYEIFKDGEKVGNFSVKLNEFGNASSVVLRTGDPALQRIMDVYKIQPPATTETERRRKDDLATLSGL